MLDLILNVKFIWAALIALAVVTPVAAIAVSRARPALRGRRLAAAGAFGPVALLFWIYHNLVLMVLGFDSVASLLTVIITAIVAGVLSGRWISASDALRETPEESNSMEGKSE